MLDADIAEARQMDQSSCSNANCSVAFPVFYSLSFASFALFAPLR
jgi:hypothetical protein